MAEQIPQEYSRVAYRIEGVGVALILLGMLFAVATVLSWLDIGRWTVVLTWSGVLALGMLSVGWLVFEFSYRCNARIRRRYAEWLVTREIR